MSDTYRLAELLHYVAPRVPTSTHLRIAVAMADFQAHARLGHSLTGTMWRKSPEFAYPDGMGEVEWERVTQGFWRRAQPLWRLHLGDLFAAWVLYRILRKR